MNRTPALRLFDFGRAVEKYQTLTSDITNFELYNATINIIDFIEEFDLTISKARIEKSISLMLLVKKIDEESKNNPKTTVKEKLLLEIKNEINNTFKRQYKEKPKSLREEFEGKIIAYPDSQLISIEKLIKEPYNLFIDESILLGIPPSIMNDFLSFCNCYVYGLYTSSAFHILKATENYNIYFYEKISKKKISSMKWGTLIIRTEEKLDELNSKNKGFKILKRSLEDLKKNNRIKIIHENKIIYDEEEAFNIFEDCRIIISKMYYILKDRGLIEKTSFI